MPADSLYPLKLQPVYQTYLWGGSRLKDQLGRTDTPDGIVAESWEVTDRPDGMSVVQNGPLAGKTLRDVIEGNEDDILGVEVESDLFPLLIKVLDAEKTLSVQVHPNDATAAAFGGEAKTEMWYVLDATEDAKVYCGLKEDVTPEAFRAAIENKTLDEWLVTIPVKKGQAIFVPGGRVHAIGSGCLLLEVQQNSNTTYRIYDWARVDADGNTRELHIDQAMDVSLWEDKDTALHDLPEAERDETNITPILETPFFNLDRLILTEDMTLENDGSSFEVLFAVDGDVVLEAGGEEVTVEKGSSVLIPAGIPETDLSPVNPGTEVVLIRM